MEKNRTTRQVRATCSKFQTRETEKEKRIEGYFAVFDSDSQIWDGASESVDRHAFDNALGDDVRCLIDHESRLVLGRTRAGTLELRTDDHGLWGSVVINEADQDAMNLYARVQRGDVDQCSFGFDITGEEVEWRDNGEVHWTIKSVKLYEVSCVTFPAYTETSINARKADYEAIQKRKTEEWKARMKGRIAKWHSDS